ncbi:hypothetical protein PACTADRAFT_4619 [Pachysolen tannophilus NRRL Y-2460]|uniref:Signal recognition particle receptor subunit beta n=1 Tax=Pachysolen tannophilus NRRL Y-2460 TaxID=669874 RepID=A0A1E4TPM6_PACTA|nr:hypothetical protein PACTADRAFT_4619 [Pachysolen tannophilus NRRL Y-2460]
MISIGDPIVVTAIVGLIVVLVLAGVFHKEFLFGFFKNDQKTFLICGPNNSGKTSLFYLLATGKVPSYPPQMSQVPNFKENYQLPSSAKVSIGENFKLIDYPGHPKLLNLYLYKDLKNKKFLKNCKGIIFVLDSSSINEFEIGKMLYEILSKTEFLPNGVDILVACNKSDLFQSKPVFKIKEILEAEMNKIRINNSKNINKIDSSEGDIVDGGEEDFLTISSGSGSGSVLISKKLTNGNVGW